MDRELRASIDRLRESVDALREAIERRPSAAGDRPRPDDVHGQLQTLSRMMAEDLISEDEYDERKEQLLRHWPG
jgi:hypothetical protein